MADFRAYLKHDKTTYKHDILQLKKVKLFSLGVPLITTAGFPLQAFVIT